jgi:hypothetical protein
MTMRTTLLSGIAGVAIAGAISLGAYAQTDTAAPTAAPQATNPGQTPATAPSAGIPGGKKVHHHLYKGQSGPQDSTPAEAAATERLNQQQLQQAHAVQPATPVTPVTPPAPPAAPVSTP